MFRVPFFPSIRFLPRVFWIVMAFFLFCENGCNLKSADDIAALRAEHPDGANTGGEDTGHGEDDESPPLPGGNDDGGEGGPTDEWGNPLPLLSLPFEEGDARLCTQGANDLPTHQFPSTKWGVDWDTSNTVDEPVFSPVPGVVHVHDDPTNGFGRHVCVELDDAINRSVCLAHLDAIFVADGTHVQAGQIIGIEGCTGNCTGDHVHMGLMEGDPSASADDLLSIPFAYQTRDVTTDEVMAYSLPVEDLVCGLTTGHHYESQLRAPRWHPDGVLVQVPGSPDIYVVDQGTLHLIEDEEVFSSYNWKFSNVVQISPREFACWDVGETLMVPECYRAAVDSNGMAWMAYECADNPGRFRRPVPFQPAEAVLDSWGIVSVAPSGSVLAATLLSYPVGVGPAYLRDGTIVRETSSDQLYVIIESVAMPFDDPSVWEVLGLSRLPVIVVPDGTLESIVLATGDCDAYQGCVDWTRVLQCGGSISTDWVEDGGTGGDDPPEDPACLMDADGDGVVDCDDNCPLHDNADQGDVDADGVGDSCDPDADGDSVPNGEDCDMFDASVGECPPPGDDDAVPDDDDETPPADDDDSHDEEPEHPPADDDATEDVPDDDVTEEPTPSSDDDSTDPPEELEDDPTPPPTPDDPPVIEGTSILEIFYTPPPFLSPYTEISLSGEYILADGSYGLLWTSGLMTMVNAGSLYFLLPGVASGDTFRFSIEFYDAPMNYLNWACVPPAPYATAGTLSAFVDGNPVSIALIDNFLGGCEDFVMIP
ncbi:peptidoglycan DD-metalloendopeptidase family protein [Candidatus Uhrbacteria bacterium]|nr:peptidoglycan DD-metalloendopeptidase family protein [Candidatus Uhrbacteria bacterium]